jgi:hypothetical protein
MGNGQSAVGVGNRQSEGHTRNSFRHSVLDCRLPIADCRRASFAHALLRRQRPRGLAVQVSEEVVAQVAGIIGGAVDQR